ncbi:MAG: prepilin-type N-terminal cleavage/methylation domain-containing protein [Gemmatimonadetes bacterium]|nr:prepilin-type N-terminal cleavage/methylation domain-containing protein [Gemmatimonadota bacterium]
MRRSRRKGGFTLIEVMAALVVFSLGVLSVVQITGVLSTLLERAGLRSEIVVVGQARLDSLELIPYTSLTLGSTVDTLQLRGKDFVCTTTITQPSVLLRQIDFSVVPGTPPGPSFLGSTYVQLAW